MGDSLSYLDDLLRDTKIIFREQIMAGNRKKRF